MKKVTLLSAWVLFVYSAFPQGQVVFDNRANGAGTPGTFPGVVIAPFYNCDPAYPGGKWGNTSAGSPAGSQTYNTSLLFNDATHHYTVTLWALKSTSVIGDEHDNNLNLVATTTMRTTTSGNNAGRVVQPIANPVVYDVVPNSSDRATFQVRIWDDRGGTIPTWEQFLAAGANGPWGYSMLFTVPYALGSGLDDVPNLEGLQSFSLICVPEPSVIALGTIGVVVLTYFRSRRS